MKIFLFLSFILATISAVSALDCTAQWQCSPVTTDYNYATCINGKCACLSNNGFIGAATTSSKCACSSDYTVTWVGSQPYCYNLLNAVALQKEFNRCQILKDRITTLYNGLIWPSSQQIMYALIGGVPSQATNLFAPVSNGRVDPAGEFHDFAGFTEYFYGTLWMGTTRVPHVDIQQLLCNGNKVSVRLNIFFQAYATPTGDQVIDYYNLTQSGLFSFDDNNLINGTDLIIHNIGKVSDPRTPAGPDILGGVCYMYFQAQCTSTDDPTGYYTDFNDCFAHLSSIPFGSWNDLRSDTTLCRFYHALLALADKIHCKHVGKNGGGKCITRTYESYYDTVYIV